MEKQIFSTYYTLRVRVKGEGNWLPMGTGDSCLEHVLREKKRYEKEGNEVRIFGQDDFELVPEKREDSNDTHAKEQKR